MTTPTFLEALNAASWVDDLRLGFEPMDATHQEFVVLVDALLAAPDAGVADALVAVHAHSREHFEMEERWMEETGFPATGCHRDEHAAVLASMEGVGRKLAAGDVLAARRLARALADWFPGHAHHLDSALAHWMCKRTLGGKPVVLRRRKQVRSATAPAAAA
jgi:hemerythrin